MTKEWIILPCKCEIVKERACDFVGNYSGLGNFSRKAKSREKNCVISLFVVGNGLGVLDTSVAGDRDQGVGAVERFDLLRKFAGVRL